VGLALVSSQRGLKRVNDNGSTLDGDPAGVFYDASA
jgi:hypothetical protein